MADVDVIVFATPLYFFSASAQTKLVMDRMFSLYKWDNEANTMKTPLKGKTMIVLASAFENIGLDALEKPFKLTADYTSMKYESLLVENAGTSGEIIQKRPDIKRKVEELSAKINI
jgi:multimeric flavodoxin WrbA